MNLHHTLLDLFLYLKIIFFFKNYFYLFLFIFLNYIFFFKNLLFTYLSWLSVFLGVFEVFLIKNYLDFGSVSK